MTSVMTQSCFCWPWIFDIVTKSTVGPAAFKQAVDAGMSIEAMHVWMNLVAATCRTTDTLERCWIAISLEPQFCPFSNTSLGEQLVVCPHGLTWQHWVCIHQTKGITSNKVASTTSWRPEPCDRLFSHWACSFFRLAASCFPVGLSLHVSHKASATTASFHDQNSFILFHFSCSVCPSQACQNIQDFLDKICVRDILQAKLRQYKNKHVKNCACWDKLNNLCRWILNLCYQKK